MSRIRILVLITLLWLILLPVKAQIIFDRQWGADYYNNPYLAGDPIFGRFENAVGFDWGEGSPDRRIPDDNFSVRFSKGGYLPAGAYRFIITADEGFRLYIDNIVVIDAWDEHDPGVTLGQDVRLEEGNHQIQIDYREFSGTAFIFLDWGAAPDGTDAISLVEPEKAVDDAIGTVTVTASALNVRSEPRIANNVIARVQRGQQFPLLGRSDDGNWVHISVDNMTSGWISSAYVRENDPTVVPDNSGLSGIQLRSDARLFVRVSPDSDSEIIGLLHPGEVVPIIARNEDLTWWQIRDGSVIGWVSAQFVTLSPDVNPVRVSVADTP